MAGEIQETRIAVGMTDESRFIAVSPPLSQKEIEAMEWAGGLPVGKAVQMTEHEPRSTMFLQSDFAEIRGIDTGINKTEHAKNIAAYLANALRNMRDGHVEWDPHVVVLYGEKSTPFVPNTDVIR
jgi:hypothetical protein